MIGYDFDKTIYKGDCSTNFFFYIVLKRPYLLLFTPYFLFVFLLYGIKLIGKKKFKELMYFFIPWHKDVDKIVLKFWEKNRYNFAKYYIDQQKDNDIIISAGLRFIVEPAMDILKIRNYMATEFDVKTGKIVGENCYGQEKVNRFKEVYGEEKLEAFYSDSMSDLPMMQISNEAYLVNEEMVPSKINLDNIESEKQKKNKNNKKEQI